MASKFIRGQGWWVKYRHPATGARIRESLGTGDEARAELLRRRIELEAALLDHVYRQWSFRQTSSPRSEVRIVPHRR